MKYITNCIKDLDKTSSDCCRVRERGLGDIDTQSFLLCYYRSDGSAVNAGDWDGQRDHGRERNNKNTLCPKQVYPLMFDNNFGKCGPILKILSPTDS